MTALAEFPYAGEVGAFTSYSIADPLPGLLSDPTVPRIFLLRATPTGGNVDVASGRVFTDGKAFQSGLPQPHNFSTALPIPGLAGGAENSVSDLIMSNPDGELDSIVAHGWLGADAPVYVGPRAETEDQAFARFTRIFAGVAEGVAYDPSTIRVLMRDARFRLTRRLETERYMGTDACLRFDGSGDWVDYGDILDKGAGDSFTAEILFRTTTTGANQTLAGKKESTSGTHAGWRLNFTATDVLTFNIADGVTTPSISATVAGGAWLDGKWHRVTAICNRSTQVLLLYVDGVFVAVSTSIAGMSSLANAIPLQVGAINSTLAWNGDLDDFRMWNAARGAAQLADDAFRELDGSEGGLDLYSQYNENTGTTAADSSPNGRDGTITGATWVGSLEGDAAIAGQPKPRAYGRRRQVAPRLVDPFRLVYQVNNGSMQAITAVRDNGDPLNFGSDVSDIYGSAPAAGTYNTDLSHGLIRLNAAVGEITVDFEGDDAGALGYQNTGAGIARKIFEAAGFTGDALNSASFDALDTAQPAVVGHYFDADINFDEAADMVLSGIGSWWAPTRAGAVEVGRIVDPAALTPTVSWSLADDLVELIEVRPLRSLVNEVRVSYRPYHKTLTADQVATGVPAAQRDDFGKEVRWAFRHPTNYLSLPADAATLEVHSSFDNRQDALAEASRLAEWFSTQQWFYRIKPESGTLAYFIGTIGNLTGSRYNLDTGVNLAICGVVENVGSDAEADSLEILAIGGEA